MWVIIQCVSEVIWMYLRHCSSVTNRLVALTKKQTFHYCLLEKLVFQKQIFSGNQLISTHWRGESLSSIPLPENYFYCCNKFVCIILWQHPVLLWRLYFMLFLNYNNFINCAVFIFWVLNQCEADVDVISPKSPRICKLLSWPNEEMMPQFAISAFWQHCCTQLGHVTQIWKLCISTTTTKVFC